MFTVKHFALWEHPGKAQLLGTTETVNKCIDLLRTRFKVAGLQVSAIKGMAYGSEWGDVFLLKIGRGSENVTISRHLNG